MSSLTNPESTPKTKKPTMESLRQRAETERDAWLAEMGQNDVVESAVDQALEQSFKNILQALLGMKMDRWDHEWTVDNVNGRKSPIRDAIEARCTAKAIEWVNAALEELPPPTAKQKKAIREEFLQQMEYQLRDRVADLANEAANKMVDEVLAVEPVVDSGNRS